MVVLALRKFIIPGWIVRSSLQHMLQCRCAQVAACWLALASCAFADSGGAGVFSFSAFGTFGAVHSSDERADFTTSVLNPSGAGFTHAWSTNVDSRLGGQVIARMTPQLSVIVQVISEQLYDNTYRPHVEWANLEYQPLPELSLRIGRIVLPTFMFADTRKVGYAIPWVRPPVELYNSVPVTISDGVDVSYVAHLGEVANRLIATFGQVDVRLPPDPGGSVYARDIWLLSDSVEYGAATVRVVYQSVHLRAPALEGLFDALREFGPQGRALADRYDPSGKRARLASLGAQYDPGHWFVMGEWGTHDFHSVFGKTTAWYVGAGYRWRSFTPYLIYSQVNAASNTSDPGLTVSEYPAGAAPSVIGLNAGLNAFLGSVASQKTVSIGARWDVARNIDLKLQYDRLRTGSGSAGTLINVQPDFRRGSGLNLISATIDFVL